MILGAMSLRASLEQTPDPRAADLCRQILPWLGHMGCADELDPI
jgi:hypothetical protein